jgi:hypothetical protein
MIESVTSSAVIRKRLRANSPSPPQFWEAGHPAVIPDVKFPLPFHQPRIIDDKITHPGGTPVASHQDELAPEGPDPVLQLRLQAHIADH